MQTINKETKRGKSFIMAFANSSAKVLRDVYKRFSNKKQNAYDNCSRMCDKENGSKFCIISAGRYTFSVGWLTDDGLRVETAKGSYLIK